MPSLIPFPFSSPLRGIAHHFGQILSQGPSTPSPPTPRPFHLFNTPRMYTLQCCYIFVTDNVEEGLKLSEILTFWTGADQIPPMGFDHKLRIEFYCQDVGCRRLPTSSTCALVMWLPRAVEPEELQQMLTDAIRMSAGFGKAWNTMDSDSSTICLHLYSYVVLNFCQVSSVNRHFILWQCTATVFLSLQCFWTLLKSRRMACELYLFV